MIENNNFKSSEKKINHGESVETIIRSKKIMEKIIKFLFYSSFVNFSIGAANLIILILLEMNSTTYLEYRYSVAISSIFFSIIIYFLLFFLKRKNKEITEEYSISIRNPYQKELQSSQNKILLKVDEEKNLALNKNECIKHIYSKPQTKNSKDNHTNCNSKKINLKNLAFYEISSLFFSCIHITLQSQNFYTMLINFLNKNKIDDLILEFKFHPILFFCFTDVLTKFILVSIYANFKILFLSNSLNLILIIIFEYIKNELSKSFTSIILYFIIKIFLQIFTFEKEKSILLKISQISSNVNMEIEENSKEKNVINNEVDLKKNYSKINNKWKNNSLDYIKINNNQASKFKDKEFRIERYHSWDNFRSNNYAANFDQIINFKNSKKENITFSKFKNSSNISSPKKNNHNIAKLKGLNIFSNYSNDEGDYDLNKEMNQNRINTDFFNCIKTGYINFSISQNKIKYINNFFKQTIQYFISFKGVDKIMKYLSFELDENKEKIKIFSEIDKSDYSTRPGTFINKNSFEKKQNNAFLEQNKNLEELKFVKQLITGMEIIDKDINLFGETRDKFFEILRELESFDLEEKTGQIGINSNNSIRKSGKNIQNQVCMKIDSDQEQSSSENKSRIFKEKIFKNKNDLFKNENHFNNENFEKKEPIRLTIESDTLVKNVQNDEINLEVYRNQIEFTVEDDNLIALKDENKAFIPEKSFKLKSLSFKNEEREKKNCLNKQIKNLSNIKLNINDSIGSIVEKENQSKDAQNLDLTIDDFKENFKVSPREKYINKFNYENENMRKAQFFPDNNENSSPNNGNHNINFNFKRFNRKSKIINEEINKINQTKETTHSPHKDNLILFFIENSESFKKFTYIGKKTFYLKTDDNSNSDNNINNCKLMSNSPSKKKLSNCKRNFTTKNILQNFLSVEIYIRINKSIRNNQESTLEILLNDVTKSDLFFGVQQYIISSCQFLHDFKNPLLCINQEISESKAKLEKILKSIEIDKKEKYEIIKKYKFIKEFSEFCQGIIQSYENYSKLLYKPTNFNLDIKTFKLSRFIKFFKNFMEIRLKKSNKSVKFTIVNGTSHNYLIKTDENKLKQILLNLLSNSEKFTLRGKIELKIQEEFINNKNYVKFNVEDSGIGMDMNEQKQLFTPFSTKDKQNLNPNGMGLGLVIVREISGKLGLPIQIESKIGVGTKSWFYVENLKLNATKSNAKNSEINNKKNEKKLINFNINNADSISKLNDQIRETIKIRESDKKFKFASLIENMTNDEKNISNKKNTCKNELNKNNNNIEHKDNNLDNYDSINNYLIKNNYSVKSLDIINLNPDANNKIQQNNQNNHNYSSSIDDFIHNGSRNKNLLQSNIHNSNGNSKSDFSSNETEENNQLSLSSLSYDSQKSIVTKSLKSIKFEEAMKMDSQLFRNIRKNLEPQRSDLSLIDGFYVDLNLDNNSIFFETVLKNRNSCIFNGYVNPIEDHIDLINFKNFIKKTEPRKKINNPIQLNQNEHLELLKKMNYGLIKTEKRCDNQQLILEELPNNMQFLYNYKNGKSQRNTDRDSIKGISQKVLLENKLYYNYSNDNAEKNCYNNVFANHNKKNEILNSHYVFGDYKENNFQNSSSNDIYNNGVYQNGLYSSNNCKQNYYNKIVSEISFNFINKRKNSLDCINYSRNIDDGKEKCFIDKNSENMKRFNLSNKKDVKDTNLNRESINSALSKAKKLKKLEVEQIQKCHINHPYSAVSVNLIKKGDEDNLNEFYSKKNHLKEIFSSNSNMNKLYDIYEKHKLDTIPEDNKSKKQVKFSNEEIHPAFDKKEITKIQQNSIQIKNYNDPNINNKLVEDDTISSKYINNIKNKKDKIIDVYKNEDSFQMKETKLCINNNDTDLNAIKIKRQENSDKNIAKENHFFLEIDKTKDLKIEENGSKLNIPNNPNNREEKDPKNISRSLQRKNTVIEKNKKNLNEILFRRNLTIKSKNLDLLLKKEEKKFNILIIDDSISIRSSCKFILLKLEKLRNCKMNIDEADDGFSGLNQIINNLQQDKKYDLIVLDDEMTYLNGTEMIKMMDLIIDKKFGQKIGLKKELFEKFVVCSANPDNLLYKMDGKNLKICPKPINLKYLQNYFDSLN